mgnify:CR=1 FL=1
MNKKEVKGIGFGIGIGVEDMLDGLMDIMTGKIGKVDDKGIYQTFTAITTWNMNGGFVQLQKFEDGKPVGHVKEYSLKEFIDNITERNIDALPDLPVIADKYVPKHIMEEFLDRYNVTDNAVMQGLNEVCGFIAGLKYIPASREFSRPDWNAKDLGQAYLMKTEEEVQKEEEVLFITSYQVSNDIFLQKTKNIKAKVVRLDYEGPDMTRFINAYDALNGVIVVVDMNAISAFQGSTKYLTDILCEMKTSYNEDEVALYVLNHIGFELIMGQDRNKIVPEGSVISK